MQSDSWKTLVATYQKSSVARATWQLVNSIGSYLAVWCAIVWASSHSIWLALPLAVFAGVLLVRVFIIFHDCGHGSFFASRRANDVWGAITGVLTWTPYRYWRAQHATHHGTTGNLDKRGVGDFWTMTVNEYLASSWGKRLAYRIVRSPIVILFVAPLVMFGFEQRIPHKGTPAREKASVWWTDLGLLAIGAGMSLILGLGTYLILQAVVIAVAGAIGIWLFYLQHQFEDAYWERGEDWDFVDASLKGSAYLRLPAVLQWFTGNIGYHHVHHLSARIPNYYLQACHESHPLFQQVSTTNLWGAVKALGLKLWDETDKKLICFRRLRLRLRQREFA